MIVPVNYTNNAFIPYMVDLKFISDRTGNTNQLRCFVLSGEETHLDKFYAIQKEGKFSDIQIWYKNTDAYSDIGVQIISLTARSVSYDYTDMIVGNYDECDTAKSSYTSGYKAYSFDSIKQVRSITTLNSTDYTTSRVRNAKFTTSAPISLENDENCFVYE